MSKFTDAVITVIKSYFETGDQPTAAQFAAFIDAVQQGIEEHDHAGLGDGDAGSVGTGVIGATEIADRTRKFVVSPVGGWNATDSADLVVSTPGLTLLDGRVCYAAGGFHCPQDLGSLTSVKALIIPSGTGNVYSEHTANYAAVGEVYNTHTETVAFATSAVTLNEFEAIQALSLASLAAGDVVNVWFRRDGTHASDTVNAIVYFLGWIVEYTADS